MFLVEPLGIGGLALARAAALAWEAGVLLVRWQATARLARAER